MDAGIETQLNEIVARVVAAVPTKEIILFGSYARGAAHAQSDLDIYVLTADDAKRAIDYLRDIDRAIRPVRRMPVDILVMPHGQFYARASLLPTLEYTVAKEGRRIYAQ